MKLVLKEEAPVDAYLISCYQFKEDFRWGYSVTDVVTDNVILQEAQPIFTLFDKKKSLILFVNVTFF